jgi:hypothetical protein
VEIAVGTERRVIVFEDLQILAHNEHVKKFFMDELEGGYGSVLPRIVYGERQAGTLAGLDRPGRNAEIEMILDRVRQAGHQSHSAARAFARIVRPNIGIHWADVDIAGVLRGKWSGSLSHSESQDQSE